MLEAGTLVTGTIDRSRNAVDVTLALVDGNSGAEFRRANFSWPEDQLLEKPSTGSQWGRRPAGPVQAQRVPIALTSLRTRQKEQQREHSKTACQH